MEEFTVLIVDDEEPICEIIADVLRWAYNLNVLVVHSASEAQYILFQQEIHLILLDIMMPGMDGLSLTRWIRSEPGLSEIPIVIVSAKASQEDHKLAFASGANNILSKPFRSIELQKVIRPYLSVKKKELV
ncbi:MAG: response regulator [Anaerolineaceae bacterium]|nr:MAG: response regulator [Anaerolineaceae bacterium]